MLVSLNKGTAAMLVSPINPPGIKFYSYANVSFCFGWKTRSLVTWVKTLYCTIIKVSVWLERVFVLLGSSYSYASSSKSFIYSLQNVNGYYPVKLQIKSGHEGNAICGYARYGPTFGGHDIHISSNAGSNQGSYFSCGVSYHLPPGYSSANSSCHASFAGSQYFTPTNIEVFYETTA